ncbi:hypothetical protein KY327_02590 [Candidatus Woesearchaeota archaeon]|nr:hypothetical protein [Candidatus Woesearchaeota archaeon]
MSYVAQMQSMGVIDPRQSQQRYGLSQESMDDIRRNAGTTAQQRTSVDPRPQQPQQQSKKHEEQAQLTINQSEVIQQLKDAIKYQAQQFDRFRELAERKFTSLSKDLMEVNMELKQAQQTIAKLRDKEDVAAARQALSDYQKGDKPPATQPIDRTGVAPSEVQLDKIFGSGR